MACGVVFVSWFSVVGTVLIHFGIKLHILMETWLHCSPKVHRMLVTPKLCQVSRLRNDGLQIEADKSRPGLGLDLSDGSNRCHHVVQHVCWMMFRDTSEQVPPRSFEGRFGFASLEVN